MARNFKGQSDEKNVVREKRTISVNDVPPNLRRRVEQEENAMAVESVKNSCKSPEGMFTEVRVPNDLKFVLQRITEYEEGDDNK